VEEVQEKAVAYLGKHCEVIHALSQRYTPPVIAAQPPEQYFEILVSTIIGQQLSVKAAATIEARLRQTLGEINPQSLVSRDDEELRAVGLSYSKAGYIKGLADAFHSGNINPSQLATAEPPEVIQMLTALRGIGPWSAEMFLIFGRGDPDVWSPGDYGLKKAVEAHFGEGVDTQLVASRWSPYRSYAALYLWEYIDKGVASTNA
jgi:DNA-3-methyladenine glycosylase II